MAKSDAGKVAGMFRKDWQRRLQREYLPQICKCLEQLSEKEIWWRPNAASNSVGNLVLHLSGNVRQWIISGLGGAVDVRNRDLEFSEKGPIPRRVLIRRLRGTVNAACGVIGGMSAGDLSRRYKIQGYDVTGWSAAGHVQEHFAYHAGQIFYITKMKRAKDLRFTRLPASQRKTR